ncbi:MAG: SPASM domain-containing protein [Fibrobacter sp.]|nr:SPASM domain-containing protein [Fibrobacter sp.]
MDSVYIEITDACNLRCSFCPCGKRNRTSDSQDATTPGAANGYMPSALFEKCLAGAQGVGAKNVYFHVLGEPTLHPGFIHYVKKLEPTPLKLTLVTNGTTIARTGRALLQSPAVRQVNFSTHAYAELDRDTAEKHLQNVIDFCKASLAARPDIYINLRLWNVGDRDAAPWNSFFLARVNEAFGTSVEPGHFCSRHKSFNVTGRLYLHEDSRFEWPHLDGSEMGVRPESVKGTCHALGTHIAILHDGRVAACCLDHAGHIELGNIATQPLPEILESPLARELHDAFTHHELRHPLCQACSYCRRFK